MHEGPFWRVVKEGEERKRAFAARHLLKPSCARPRNSRSAMRRWDSADSALSFLREFDFVASHWSAVRPKPNARQVDPFAALVGQQCAVKRLEVRQRQRFFS